MLNETQILQEKLKAINSLSNCIQKLNANQGKRVAYLIHQIIEADYLNNTLSHDVTSFKLLANAYLFFAA